MNNRRLLLALLILSLSLISLGCDDTDPVASSGSSIILSANPSDIEVGDLSTISAVVQSSSGILLDGVQVIFTSRDGSLFEVGSNVSESPLVVLTTNGIAKVQLTTPTTTTVRGQSGSASGEVTVTVAGMKAVGSAILRLVTSLPGTPPTAAPGSTIAFSATVLDTRGQFFVGATVVVEFLQGTGMANPAVGETGGLATFDFEVQNVQGPQLEIRVLAQGIPSNTLSVTVQ